MESRETPHPGRARAAARRVIFAAMLALLGRQAPAETVSVDLKLTPPGTENRIAMEVDGTVLAHDRTDSDTGDATGDILADLGISFDAGAPAVKSIDTITLTGGHVAVSDMSFSLDWGPFVGGLSIDSKKTGGTFDTPSPPGEVTAGQFPASDHELILDEGTFLATGSGLIAAFMPSNPYGVDLTKDPIRTTSDAQGKIAVAAPTIAAGIATYEVTLTLPVLLDKTAFDQPGQGTMSVKGSGTILAKGTFTRPVSPPAPAFRRGDCNGDGAVDLADPVRSLVLLFLDTAIPPCEDACDANDDGAWDVADTVYALAWLFTGGPEPPAPGPVTCGSDGTAAAAMSCASYPGCP